MIQVPGVLSAILQALSGCAFQVGQDFHVAVEAWWTAGEMFACLVVPFWNRMAPPCAGVGVGRAVYALGIRKALER